MRFRLKHLLLAAAIVAFFVWSMKLSVLRTQHNIETTRSTYAALLVAEMCVTHMKSNGQAWPTCWEDLSDDFQPCLARSGQTWAFADLEQRIAVDWRADPVQVLANPDSAAVIWIVAEPDATFRGLSPNDILVRHLSAPKKPGG